MFGRGKPQQQNPEIMDSVFGAPAGQMYEEPIEPYGAGGEYIDETNPDCGKWHVLTGGEQRADGRNWYIIGQPGFYTHEQYARALGITSDDLAYEAGHVDNPYLQEIKQLNQARFTGRTDHVSGEDDTFEVEIEELKGLKVRGKGSLQQILVGRQQSDPIKDALVQRILGFDATQSAPGAYVPAAPGSYPWEEPQSQQSLITQSPYELDDDEMDDRESGLIDATPRYEDDDAYGINYTDETSSQALDQTNQNIGAADEENNNAQHSSEQSDDVSGRRHREHNFSLGRAALYPFRKLGPFGVIKLAVLDAVLVTGPSIVHNGVPHSPAEAAGDAAMVNFQVAHDILKALAKAKGLVS